MTINRLNGNFHFPQQNGRRRPNVVYLRNCTDEPVVLGVKRDGRPLVVNPSGDVVGIKIVPTPIGYLERDDGLRVLAVAPRLEFPGLDQILRKIKDDEVLIVSRPVFLPLVNENPSLRDIVATVVDIEFSREGGEVVTEPALVVCPEFFQSRGVTPGSA